MFAPLRLMHKLSPRLATSISKRPRESWFSDGTVSRSLSGHLIAIARREAGDQAASYSGSPLIRARSAGANCRMVSS